MKQNMFEYFLEIPYFKKTLEGNQTLGTSACWEAWEPECDLQNPCRERKESQCLLTSMCALVYTQEIHQNLKKKTKKKT